MMAQPRHYYSEDHMAERQPLSHPGATSPQVPNHASQEQYYNSSPSRNRPAGAHPDSSFDRLRAQRRRSQEPAPPGGRGVEPYAAGPYATGDHSYNNSNDQYHGYQDESSPYNSPAPQPPPHRTNTGNRRSWGQQQQQRQPGYPPQSRPIPQQNNITPGADNFGNAAVGGMTGIALSVADQNARDSGLNAVNYPQQAYQQQDQRQNQGQGHGERGRLAPERNPFEDRNSQSSAGSMSQAAPGSRTPSRSRPAFGTGEGYNYDPHQVYIRPSDPDLGVVNPLEIEDDGDDGLQYPRKGPRTSMLSLGSSHKGAIATAAVAGGAAGASGSAFASRNGSAMNVSNQYTPMYNAGAAGVGSGSVRGGGYNPAYTGGEKTGRSKGKKWRLAIIIIIAILAIAGLVLGILFGVVFKNKTAETATQGGPTLTAAGDTAANGDLDINSDEIKALMSNKELKKVFPGMDYTPIHVQYPECIHHPPSQNNITRDLAVLSQLTNTIRLYGTDCNQTQMLIHAVNQLQLKDKVTIWLGVWQDANSTTNERQLHQMWDILDEYGDSYFKGIIVANEILFRDQMTLSTLGSLLKEVRTNLTARGMSLPVATSDLGDKWDSSLAAQSDAIMGNIHPFFAGEPASTAADWTMGFFVNKTGTYSKANKEMNVIAETGWPSQGGTNCGTPSVTKCPDRSVAGIKEMNIFMEDWVCRALDDGTNYFWFEAFDEPWKVDFNEPGKEWEDHWGLMDVDRNLKPGLKIPDCGGKRIPDL